MDADAEVTRNRLGALNCQVTINHPSNVHVHPQYTFITLRMFMCIHSIQSCSIFPFFFVSYSVVQRVFRGHVVRGEVRAMRKEIAEAIKRAFAERMT